MQTTPVTFPPLPQTSYQPLSEAEIYATKKQYLDLLSPQQVVDICLTFEAHAPLHIKSSVWPYDIRAAIASIQAQKAQTSQTQTSSEPHASVTSKITTSRVNTEKTTQTSPPQQSIPSQVQTAPSASTPPPQAPPAAQGSHYPHQPYYHPTYPHAPYYAPHHATYGYPHPYPSFPQSSAMYPVNPAGHHPPLFTNTPLLHPYPAPEPPPPLSSIDDLPSYEEMIVEALLDSGDSEGCAPKDLFSWMAMHYPLQMNFRPSASQALQKAYKRGRLEKGSNGKYRLNESWEGGNTSRRTTRRPQTLAHATLSAPQPPSSPFTHAPLVSHGPAHLQTRLAPAGQPPGYGDYPFGYPYPGAPGSVPAPVTRENSGTASRKQAIDTVDHETGEGSDAWEAAQNILKAINFGQLFQMSNNEDKAGGSSAPTHVSIHGFDKPQLASGAATPGESTGSHVDSGKSAELNAEQRAALQAQLALLAAQLAELSDVREDGLSHNLEISQQWSVTVSNTHAPQVLGSGSGPATNSDDGDIEEDTVEVPAPATTLTD